MCLYCHNCNNIAKDAVVHGWCTSLEIQWLQNGILAGMALRERQCTLKGKAQYANVWVGVHWKGVDTRGVKFFISF